ncbi:unnamed protein product [Zymoseptoria tritici ST99CH_1A5]|uniref:Uncharacterized protein n=3 Tax=Zymoseptoria tritici TaxID=1047171 RepID=F9X596_ZYMTI|nr:uncharacterized protein MYCGRDRAFT_91995 [Zymoseptoria tritici IPO323]EGP89248.1 hypothetical protein MYCGRDRAFT_91995 [Zymoseptoria tritici IPO323]SMR49018.1 unnamed protein product [Zymoseptoria tritici ST99CH_1E4]SMR50195.1 unnamed protein product [Zymoseptoria tritici ST99CH_3D1]SMY22895.1 unnamed protein product [Zymoseptoria tritici ST99CH_1A5]
MNRLTFATIVASLFATTTAQAPPFHIENFAAQDIRIPSESHNVSFTVKHLGAAPQQGGDAPFDLSIAWEGCDPPPCYINSEGTGWYTRIVPGSYKGATDFTLEIVKHNIYKAATTWTARIPYVEGSAGYDCSRGGQSTLCGFQDESDSTYETVYVGGLEAEYPSPRC